MTFHQIALIVAGAMMGSACIVSFGLIMGHALHFSAPKEQKEYVYISQSGKCLWRRSLTSYHHRIIRITFTIPVFAVLSFLTILLESRAPYLTPLTDLYEAWALAGFYLLLCAYISGDDEERENVLHDNGKQGVYNVCQLLA